MVRGLLTGNYYVNTWNDQGYVDEYYNNVSTQSAATSVSVTQGSNTPIIAFGLSTVSGHLNASTLSSPSDGAPEQPASISLQWVDTNGDPQEQGYRIRIKPEGESYSYYTAGQNVTTYPASGLLPGTAYYWNVQAVGNGTSTLDSPWANSETDWSFTTQSDTVAPTPNPMAWATQPYAASSTSVTMVATTATESGSPPVSYYFDFTDSPTGGTGGADAGWQSSTSYTNTGLQPNHQYGYQVKARDLASTPNETTYSTPVVYRYTLANAPGSSPFSTLTQTCIRANWTANSNRSGTEYWCENTTKGTNSGWTSNLYWDSCGLTCQTSYSFQVKARNGDGIETAWTLLGSQSTLDCAQNTIYVSKDDLCCGHSPCFHSIQDAIDAASAPTEIKITQDTYTYIEDIILDFDEEIFLSWGWDPCFTSNSSFSTIQGSIKITNGTMIIENIILK